MRLVLHYRGHLRSNGKPNHKHELRQTFHRQLRTLWSQKPLVEQTELLVPRKGGNYSLVRPLEDFIFVPLISAEMNVVAELDVVLLRPEPPGSLITQGGDIDNRLKTLFDSLTMPQANQLPPGTAPNSEEDLFFCLLEDDNLVTKVAVRTEQLLEPDIDSSMVDLTVHIRTRVTRLTLGNQPFA